MALDPRIILGLDTSSPLQGLSRGIQQGQQIAANSQKMQAIQEDRAIKAAKRQEIAEAKEFIKFNQFVEAGDAEGAQNFLVNSQVFDDEDKQGFGQAMWEGDTNTMKNALEHSQNLIDPTAREVFDQKDRIEAAKVGATATNAADKVKIKELTTRLAKGDDVFKKAKDLRAEIETQSKDFHQTEDAIDRVRGSVENPSAAGDLALIFNYMKMLDPRSVVRESEFATAAAARAWMSETEEGGKKIPSAVKVAIQKFELGTSLTPEQRADFLDRSETLFKRATKTHDRRIDKYVSIGEQFGVKKSLLLGAPSPAPEGGAKFLGFE